jgi:hypothetical protein
MASFEWRKIVVATPWTTIDVPIIVGRRGRKLLVFSFEGAGGNWRFDPLPFSLANINQCMLPGFVVDQFISLPYSTYGPLVENEWYADDGGVGAILTITEVYQLP